jgi:uncharacterized alkaline shock family protein YloU
MIAGKTIISEDVFIELTKVALSTIESISTNSGQKISLVQLARIVAEKVAPQINVRKTDAAESADAETAAAPSVSFELKISVIYGQHIPSVVAKVRDTVKVEVESITGYKVERVDITVDRLVKPDPGAEQSDAN